MNEQQRRKEFIRAAHDVMQVWPGYAAHKFPAPDNRTDQCIQCDLRFSQELLVLVWQDCRAGRATHADFAHQLACWRVRRLHTAEVFNLGKPDEKDAVDKRKKQVIEAARGKCKFRN